MTNSDEGIGFTGLLHNLRHDPPSLAALTVGLLALLLLFSNLGVTSLPSKDDAYHAQTAKEMLHNLDPIGISYGGRYSFQSSPLPNWLIALSYSIFGINEFAARFPVAILAFLGILAVYLFTRRRWGEAAAVVTAFILTTTPLYLRYGRHSMAEVPLAFFVTLAVISLIEAQSDPRHYRWFGVYSGLAILTKSALGLMPLIIAGAFFLISGNWKQLFNRRFLIACLITLVVISIWYIPALIIHGETFIKSHFGEYLSVHTFSGHHAAEGPIGMLDHFIWVPIWYMPWTLLLVPALIWSFSKLRQNNALSILWLAVILPVILLSFITTRYTRYLIPIFPAAAILITATWKEHLSEATSRKIIRIIQGFAAVAAIAIILFPISLSEDRNDEVRELAPKIKKLVPYRYEMLNFGLDFFSYQNPLLFYTDCTLTKQQHDARRIMTQIKNGERHYGLATEAKFKEIGKQLIDGIYLNKQASSGGLVFFSLYSPSDEDWQTELEQFVPLIKTLGGSEWVGVYRLPRERLFPLLYRANGLKLTKEDEKLRHVIRYMERRGTRIGLASREAVDELRNPPGNLPKSRILAYGKRMVLFFIEQDKQ